MNFDFSGIDFKGLSNAMKPILKIPSVQDCRVTRITSAIDNLQNINRLRDMDNLYFQIEMKKQQKNICLKRLRGIASTSDIKIGIRLSLIIIIFSVIVPFIIVMFQNLIQQYQCCVFIYLIISFIFSMISMSIYLLRLCF